MTQTMREQMIAGEPYLSSDPELLARSRRARTLSAAYNGLDPSDEKGQRAALEELLAAFGPDSELVAPLQLDYGFNTTVGARSFANFGLVVLDVCPVTIGDDVLIGPGVQLLTATHPLDPRERREKWEAGKPITIGDNVWLGGGVLVCPGVTIGANTVVGAGAVVTRDLPADVVAVGNPARVIRHA